MATGDELVPTLATAAVAWLPAGVSPDVAAERFPGEDWDYGVSTTVLKVDDLLDAVLTRFSADLIVREPTDLAPLLAAEVLGIPCVNFGIARFIPPEAWVNWAGDTLPVLRARYGLPPDPDFARVQDHLYVDIVPPSLQAKRRGPVRARQWARYRPWDGATGMPPPPWLAELPERPTVLATLGTVYNDNPGLFGTFMAGLADQDVNVLCTLGADFDPDDLDVVPDNVRIEQYLPHSLVLPSCQAMLCHAGFNTMMGALCEGVPVVCVPIDSDQPFNARRCEALGLGIRLQRKHLTPEGVAGAVRAVLTEDSYRAQVARLRAEIEALPSYPKVVRRLEQVVAEGP